jgi:hypothetical protein
MAAKKKKPLTPAQKLRIKKRELGAEVKLRARLNNEQIRLSKRATNNDNRIEALTREIVALESPPSGDTSTGG